ncbi:MAG: DUF1549 domain-containing protein [Pirellulaceae bacterium]|nr:DUF1549 domain-containing protein [Pirellulaceae bacterium]
MIRSIVSIAFLLGGQLIVPTAIFAEGQVPVSFQRDIQPILRAKCQGCHQPAKPQGGLSLVGHADLLVAGDSGQSAIVPSDPDASELLRQIIAVDGQAAMPKQSPPLSDVEVALVHRWIAEGANNDIPHSGPRYDAQNPPQYTREPVITALAFSPDGRWLAVSAFHEVILLDAAAMTPSARLVGLSERIQSLTFSPDSQRLAVTGGSPGRFGEVQIWSVPQGELQLSQQITYDTLYGGCFSPDGSLLAFGAADRVVRAIDTQTGQVKLHQGAHEDWSLATAFNAAGTHLVSGGRDMTVKLTEVATERFIDNVTSITPGALKGGVNALAMHPSENQVLVGGADGTPKIYRIFRETERKIGDDSNLIRKFPAMPGRIFSVALSGDGKLLAAASTLDGASQLVVYPYEFTGQIADDVKSALSKPADQRNDADKQLITQHYSQTSPAVLNLEVADSLYAVAFHPTGTWLVTGGARGKLYAYSVPDGNLLHELVAVPIQSESTESSSSSNRQLAAGSGLPAASEQLPQIDLERSLVPLETLLSIDVQPQRISLQNSTDYVQLVVTAKYASGQTLDVTRLAAITATGTVVVDPLGLVRIGSHHGQQTDSPTAGSLQIEFNGETCEIPIDVQPAQEVLVDFVRDVNPVLTRLGCNAGTCHGAQAGKNGFQLSLRGYDPVGDIRALSDDLSARRLNTAAPDASVMLLKPVGAIPHQGGALLTTDSAYYETLRRWIAQGAGLDRQSRKVQRIEISPSMPVMQHTDTWQQFRVTAHYADGALRDVTHETVLESSNSEVCQSLVGGRIKALRRGEAALLARYEGAYAAATVTVMGDRSQFQWQDQPTYNTIDRLTSAKWQRMKILPSQPCDDPTFLRRVRLDLTGLPPSVEELKAFLADNRPTRIKRQAKIDQLLGSDDYVEHWTNKWADLLQVNSKFLGAEGASAFRDWIRSTVAQNLPYDQFASQVLTASGSNKDHPAASYYKILREPDLMMENTTHLFLAVRFNCNKCHDHPFERWTQDQYYQLSAYFAQTGLKKDPASGDKSIGGTAVEGAKPLYEVVFDKSDGEMRHQRTGQIVAPEFPFTCDYSVPDNATRRQQLSAWITSKDNPYFATSLVNRLWGYLTGTGLIEPLDDIRAGNPPSNPELLKHLTDEFLRSEFDVQHILRLICNSRTYQLSVASSQWNADDTLNYSHAKARRLPAEVLYDTVYRVTGTKTAIPGVEPGTRAAQLPDVAINPPDGFLNNLGRPARESACECERSQGLQLGPVMALVSGPTVGTAIGDDQNELAGLAQRPASLDELVQEVYLRVLNRFPTQQEINTVSQMQQDIESDHRSLESALTQREQWWSGRRAELEAERLAELEKTQAAAKQREQEMAPEREKLEQERQARIVAAQQSLDEYAKDPIAIASNFLDASGPSNNWFPLAPVSADSTNQAQLVARADRSITVSGSAEKTTYTIRYRTTLNNLRGLRLEALPLEGAAAAGPGLSANGNFVVTEIEVDAAPIANPNQKARHKLVAAKASFTQPGFDSNAVFNGKTRDQGGWAVHPRGGVVQWLTAAFSEPIDHAGGVELTIAIHQYHDAAEHRLGSFRISVTTDEGGIHVGEPEDFTAARAVPAAHRRPETIGRLLAYVDKSDARWNELRAALATAQTALAPDAELTRLQKLIAELEKATPDDAQLVQLRADFAASGQQRSNQRLTLAQDLTWALVNSPAFLFNH